MRRMTISRKTLNGIMIHARMRAPVSSRWIPNAEVRRELVAGGELTLDTRDLAIRRTRACLLACPPSGVDEGGASASAARRELDLLMRDDVDDALITDTLVNLIAEARTEASVQWRFYPPLRASLEYFVYEALADRGWKLRDLGSRRNSSRFADLLATLSITPDRARRKLEQAERVLQPAPPISAAQAGAVSTSANASSGRFLVHA